MEKKEAMKILKDFHDKSALFSVRTALDTVIPELKEPEDERIRKALIRFHKSTIDVDGIKGEDIIAWLEKQEMSYTKKDVDDAYLKGIGDTKNELEKQGGVTKLSEEEQNRFAKGVLTSCALSFINYLDAHKYEGKMCVSNGECEDIENAFHNAMWDRLHGYYCKYIEKQGGQILANSAKTCKDEQKPTDSVESRYSIGDVLCDKSCTTLSKDAQPNFEIVDIRNGMYICDKGSFPISQQDEYELVAKKIEQKPDDKVEPKFHEGDIIKPKDGSHEPWQIMQVDILDKKYRFADGYIIRFSRENDYELVEQKPSDKVEPKFKVGDWVVRGNTIAQIHDIQEQYYVGLDINGNDFTSSIFLSDDKIHLWSITDAKDGDVLAENSCIFIIQKLGDNNTAAKTYCTLYDDGDFDDGSILYFDIDSTKPATKEQRDALMNAMADAGYTFDFEKKELKKIPNSFEECEIVHVEHGKYYYCIKDYYAGGNKRASKGDVVQALNGMSMMALGVKANEYFMPVNTIKQMSAWGELDKNILLSIKCVIDNVWHSTSDIDTCYSIEELKEMWEWLDEIWQRVKYHTEWSEEDEKKRDLLINILNVNHPNGYFKVNPANTLNMEAIHVEELVDWLKSLKDRVGCEANCTTTWKPSDEQIEALEHFVRSIGESGYASPYENNTKLLYSLLEQLKKL